VLSVGDNAAVNVPLFVKLPLIFNKLVPILVNVNVAPELMVILLHNAVVAANIDGELGVPEGIRTFVEDVGTVPPHQFDATDQLVLVVPNHWPVTHKPTFKIPVPAAK